MRRTSLFLKLLLVLTATGLFLFLFVGSAIRHILASAIEGPSVRVHIVRYLKQVAKEIGNPADREQAAKFAREVGAQVRVEDKLGAWASDESAPRLDEPIPNEVHWSNELRVGRRRGNIIVVMESPGQRLLLRLPGTPFWLTSSNFVWIAVFGVLVALFAAYLAIRNLLSPIFSLNRGVDEIAKGNFSYRVVTSSRDELGKLATSFNGMSARLEEMIRAKEQLLLDISHELRSPLTRAKVALEYLPEGKARDSVALDLQELEKMVAEILESSRLESTHGSLDRVAQDLAPLLKEWVKPYARVDLTAPVGSTAEVDAERLRRVIVNLVENAVKYSEGRVRVKLETTDEGVRLSVTDSGSGIPPEELERVFEPFYRVDKSRNSRTGGYGLGLSLCRKIVEAHGGKIWLESHAGQGTSAILTLPSAFT